MIHIIAPFIVGLIIPIFGWMGYSSYTEEHTEAVGGFSDPFISLQVGVDPDNGDCLTTDGTDSTWDTCSGSGGGHEIQDEGVAETQRAALNFVGAGVSVADDSGNDATVVTISGGGSGAISTSTAVTAGNLTYWTGVNTVGQVATGTLTETATGLEFSATRGLVGGASILSLSSGFNIPLTASTSNWNTFYNTPSNRITAGTGIDWSSNTLNGVYTAGDGITLNTEDFDCDTASGSVFGCLSTTNWTSFNGRVSSSSIDTSAELDTLITDDTGSGALTFATSPTFTTNITTPSVLASSNDSGALGASGTAFSDLFLASGAVINFLAGDVTLTHSSGLLTFAGTGFVFGDNDWLGLGSSAGRLEFDDQTTDEVNILSARLGVGTTTPTVLLSVDDLASATSTIQVGGSGSRGCLAIRDSDDAGWTYVTALNGVLSASMTSCN